VSPFPTDTLEIDAHGREGQVLEIALPVLGAWRRSVHIKGFRPSMGVSGLSAREAARLRTLALATGARAIGIFDGANDFRIAFPADPEPAAPQASFGVEADLGGHPLAPVVSDLCVASFGLKVGQSLNHSLRGFTHVRAASAHGYAARTLGALGLELGVDLQVTTREFGFEPQGLGVMEIRAGRTRSAGARAAEWKDRGELRALHIVIGGVRPKTEQMDRLEAELREALWEARRIDPVVEKRVTPGVDLGAFLQVDVLCEHGGATFLDVAGRSAPALSVARRAVKRALAFLDSVASCDDVTGTAVLSAAVAAGATLELSLPPSPNLSEALTLLRDLGAHVDEEESRGLVLMRTRPSEARR
jgi:RNA 3'-terminal phosphate cyclase